jgi:protein required for attachment to host cells
MAGFSSGVVLQAGAGAMDILDTLVVVFDGAKARFFKFHADGHLRASAEMQSGLHRFTRDVVSDREGRTFSSVGSMHHAYEPKHDPHKMEKHDFVHMLVKTLDDAYDQGAFRHLIVVAPERSVGEFRDLASPRLRALVTHEVPKELTQYSEHELEERLKPYLARDAEASPPRR